MLLWACLHSTCSLEWVARGQRGLILTCGRRGKRRRRGQRRSPPITHSTLTNHTQHPQQSHTPYSLITLHSHQSHTPPQQSHIHHHKSHTPPSPITHPSLTNHTVLHSTHYQCSECEKAFGGHLKAHMDVPYTRKKNY